MTPSSDTARTAASPDILLYPDAPGWAAACERLGLGDRRPAAIGMPRTAGDVTALVTHAETVGFTLEVHRPDVPAGPLYGTLLVSLSLLTVDELARVPAGLRAPFDVCDDPSNGEVGEAT